jgi:hypothetical protein
MCEEQRKDCPVRKLGHEDRRLVSIGVGTDSLQYQGHDLLASADACCEPRTQVTLPLVKSGRAQGLEIRS